MTLALAKHELLILLGEITKMLFVFAYGGCVGSLTNVLVYRLPRGLGVVVPGSRCPQCGHGLAWRDNIPVFGWLLLRGRCRYCRRPISPQYPIVEATVGLLFVLFYLVWYGFATWPAIIGARPVLLGIDLAGLQPEWAMAGLGATWPHFVMLLILIGSLVAMTIVDARTFLIPLVLAWTPAVVGIAGHPLQAWLVTVGDRFHWRWAEGWSYAIPTPGSGGWLWIGLALGGMAGLGISLAMIRLGLIKRSFADFEQWEREELVRRGLSPDDAAGSGAASSAGAGAGGEAARTHASDDGASAGEAKAPGQAPAAGDRSAEETAAPDPPRDEPSGRAGRTVATAMGVTVFTGGLGALVASGLGVAPALGLIAGLVVGPVLGGAIARILMPEEPEPRGPEFRAADAAADASAEEGVAESAPGEDAGTPEPEASGPALAASEDAVPADLWLEYPHARREMVREVLFLGPVVAAALLGGVLARRLAGPWTFDVAAGREAPSVAAPLWLEALAGALLGYLIGGGVVWLVRIVGSLLFRKEAMGLGDVHLMAGVGACLGWIDPVVAFFVAAPVGLYVELVRRAASPGAGRRAMPFGPSLAAATLLVMLAKPGLEAALTAWLARPIDLP